MTSKSEPHMTDDSIGEEIRDDVESLRRERDELKDKYLRSQAECANVARRLNQQFAEEKRIASMSFARDLLPVLDNFDRTLASMGGKSADDPIAQGVKLIAEQLTKTLAQHGIAAMDSADKPFDPERHQALMQDFETRVAPGTVTRELERGYMIHDRVLRPAKVIVAASREESGDTGSGEA